MPRFIPPLDPATLTNNGERDVATALVQQLPDGVTIYHGYLFLERAESHSGRAFYREGEIDFVILDPRRGLIVLEVKGGTIQYDPEGDIYRRVETKQKIQDPFEQARENMHALVKRIQSQPEFGGGRLPFVRGYAVVFPHCNWSGQLPADVQPEMILGYDDLGRLGQRLTALLDLWSRRDQIDPPTETTTRGIRAGIQSALSLIPVLAPKVTDQEECLRRATDEQARVLEYMRTMPRVAFNGVAGSGKTLLALAQAQTFARQGTRTLLVCYNRPLADWLAAQFPADLRSLVHVSTFHSLCQSMCRKMGVPFQPRDDDDFWLYYAADSLEKAAIQLPAEERFEAVVVDEGQDFRSIWLRALRLITRTQDDTSPLYWFYDPRQNLSQGEDPMVLPPNMAGPVLLNRNCRNTRRIARRCGAIIREEFGDFPGLPDGEEVREVQEASLRDVIRTTRDQVLTWTEKGGRLRPDQIAILTPREPGDEWPTKIGTTPLGDDFDRWRRGECILLSPHRRFKGLEADALILADVPTADSKPYFTTADFYVACSRAKHLLTVVGRG